MIDTLQYAMQVNPTHFQGVIAEERQTSKGEEYFVVIPPPYNLSSRDTEYTDDIIY